MPPDAPEVLGTFRSQVDNQAVESTAYVTWLPDPAASIASQLPEAMTCPACTTPINLSRLQNLAGLQQVNIFSVSVTCSVCSAVFHFDKTPEADRAGLAWLNTYRR
jgi:hypothetical protein